MPSDTLHLERFEYQGDSGAAAEIRLLAGFGLSLDIGLSWKEDGQPYATHHIVSLHGENLAKVRALCTAVLAATETMAPVVHNPQVGDWVEVTKQAPDGPLVGYRGLLYRVDYDSPRYKFQHAGFAYDVKVIAKGGGDWLTRASQRPEATTPATDPVTRSALAQAEMREAQAREQDQRAAETPHASDRASHERHAARLREQAAEHREDAGLVRPTTERLDMERRVAALPPIPEGWEQRAWTLERYEYCADGRRICTWRVGLSMGNVICRRSLDDGLSWEVEDPPQAPAFYLLSKWYAGPGRTP